MKEAYLEITFRRGRPIAAYYYLPRLPEQRACRTIEAAPGVLVDYAEGDCPIGVEITAPGKVTLETMNEVLCDLGVDGMEQAEFAPLRAA